MKVFQAHGDGYSLIIAQERCGVMFELTASGMTPIREMWTNGQTADNAIEFIQTMLPLEIDLGRGSILDTTLH